MRMALEKGTISSEEPEVIIDDVVAEPVAVLPNGEIVVVGMLSMTLIIGETLRVTLV